MLISETHFTDKSYLQIPGYEIYTTEYPDGTAHGGTAVIIRKTVKHHELTEYKTEEIQATSVMITENGRPLTLTAVYCPPKHQITEDQFTTFLKTLGRRFIAGGDYNAKHQQWGPRLNTLRGKNLLKVINKLNVMTLSTGEPSYWPTDMNKTPDLLDFFLAKGIIPATIKIKTNYDLSSDHTPVEMTICSSVTERRSPPKLCNKFTNWDKFRIYVNNSLSVNMPLKSSNDIDNAVLHLTEVIRNAAWRATPKSEVIKNLPYPKEIRQKITEKRRLRRIYMYTRQPEDKKKHNASAQQLKRELKEYQNTKFSNYVNSLSPTAITNYSLWKATKKKQSPTTTHLAH
ncbi:hypothetical protein R5R35_008138 [Gryllus longicercus]|uniref:Endonuclease/exonuclease/phosphatase domain-containing protein n=1 Tax=Gryllus longicercus TaxID=2509291 RepID=A0AAN9VJM7_9ORTH